MIFLVRAIEPRLDTTARAISVPITLLRSPIKRKTSVPPALVSRPTKPVLTKPACTAILRKSYAYALKSVGTKSVGKSAQISSLIPKIFKSVFVTITSQSLAERSNKRAILVPSIFLLTVCFAIRNTVSPVKPSYAVQT